MAARAWFFSPKSLVIIADGPSDSTTETECSQMGMRAMDMLCVLPGWYACTLVVVDGITAVHLSGRTADGKPYSDVYPITKEDWETLKNEGYKVEL